jgi:Uma2 family endonuclease
MTTLPKLRLPPLQSGDRLTRDEFYKRYSAMPRVKAELIEGVVYMASPVSAYHSDPHADIQGWVWTYAKLHTPRVQVSDNASIELDAANEVQPDAMAYIAPEYGGRVNRSQRGGLSGAPEMAIEVAATSASIDLGSKAEVYRRVGVKEYIVWCVFDERIDWFVNRNGKFEPLQADADGIVKSECFPGLWLDVPAMLRGDYGNVQKALLAGIATPEHAEFARSLAARRQ